MNGTHAPSTALAETCPRCDGIGEVPGPGATPARCPECDGIGRSVRTTHEPASGTDHDPDHVELLRTREQRDQAKRDLAEAAEQLGLLQTETSRQRTMIAELTTQRSGLERRLKEQDGALNMYVHAWVRELGGRIIPKGHQIDSLVMTTAALRLFAEDAWRFIKAVARSPRRQVVPGGKFDQLLERAKKAGFE